MLETSLISPLLLAFSIVMLLVVAYVISRRRDDLKPSNQLLSADKRKEYCEILGVPRNATLGEIRKAFRAKARVLHPETKGTGNEQAFKTLAASYDALVTGIEANQLRH